MPVGSPIAIEMDEPAGVLARERLSPRVVSSELLFLQEPFMRESKSLAGRCAAALALLLTLGACAGGVNLGVSIPVGRSVGVGVSVGTDGRVGAGVGARVGGASVRVGTSGQLPLEKAAPAPAGGAQER
ncbi:hypothetical protein [Hydrogenophaga sp.]|uniref:hypothetical protein n=1 Tax=Hydrogenophaga sp. TaxID=1904254 RepID=UPI0019CCF975|nr:hypothetical protein [Hydrogenophaga sp.]MBD3893370.1 hypothetical protein [Hydrogenophaga sp.]